MSQVYAASKQETLYIYIHISIFTRLVVSCRGQPTSSYERAEDVRDR